jgi:DNA repair protein RadC
VTWSKDCFLPNTEFRALSFIDKPYHAVADLPPSERPLRQLRDTGPSAISIKELLACLLHKFTIRSPADIAMPLMAEMSHLEQEHFKVLTPDTRNRVLADTTLYIGCLNTSHIRVGEVFREAVKRNAAAIIVVHNHPSGDPTPSPEDVKVTRHMFAAGEMIDIKLLDHLIIGQQRFISGEKALPRIVGVEPPAAQVDRRATYVGDHSVFITLHAFDLPIVVDIGDLDVAWGWGCFGGERWRLSRLWRLCCRGRRQGGSWSRRGCRPPQPDATVPGLLLHFQKEVLVTDVGRIGGHLSVPQPYEFRVDEGAVGQKDVAQQAPVLVGL